MLMICADYIIYVSIILSIAYFIRFVYTGGFVSTQDMYIDMLQSLSRIVGQTKHCYLISGNTSIMCCNLSLTCCLWSSVLLITESGKHS